MNHKRILQIIICLFAVSVCVAQEQNPSIKKIFKGVVIDTEGNAIQNASIFIDGKNAKILSDKEGEFELKLKSKVKKIAVFTISHGMSEVAYNGQDEISFILPLPDKKLTDSSNEAVGKENDRKNRSYIKAHKRNLKKRFSKVDQSTLKNRNTYVTIFDMIQGTVPGVKVSGSTVTIRGASSFVLSNEPLFVVNGMPVSSINHISPDQVKSIKVLKGSAAAIYGVRGANGVIVINLKTSSEK